MSRYNVATGINNPNNPLTVIVDTQGRALGVTIQNVSAQDFFWSVDPATLQKTDAANLPTAGHHMPPDNPAAPFIVVIPSYKGKIYARSQNQGAQAETSTYDNC